MNSAGTPVSTVTTIDGTALTSELVALGVSHVVWLPDSVLGAWETALSERLQLIRVCREGEAWLTAAGLMLGGQQPVVVMQNTGLFESGDALRNTLFDLRLPIYALIGYRSYLAHRSSDTAKRFTEPILAAWGLDTVLLEGTPHLPRLADHFRRCRAAQVAGAALVAEGAV